MKPTRRLYVVSVLGGALVLNPVITQARPRPPLPPVPENSLAGWRFDDATNVGAGALLAVNACAVESWSGYALQMSGKGPALFAVPQVTASGKTNFIAAVGTLRFWFAPGWGSASEGSQGPGVEARLLEAGAWADGMAESWWTLAVTADGNTIRFGAVLGGEMFEVLKAPIGWRAGSWHQVALEWSAKGAALYLDGKRAAEGEGVALAAPAKTARTAGFCLGSDVNGLHLAQGQFDELVSFGRACSDDEIAWNYTVTAPVAALGPITPEEEKARRQQATFAGGAKLASGSPSFWPSYTGLALDSMGGCASALGISAVTTNDGTAITLTITNAETGRFYDLFRTLELVGNPATNSVWRWVAKGTNGQSFTFPNVRCAHAFYGLGCDTDSDNDGLTDAFEMLVSKTSPSTNRTYYSTGLDDLAWWLRSNVLVNDPEQDCGNEQNSQFETTVRVVGTNVIVAWVDSNRGVYGLGSDARLTNYAPRFVGYAVSRDGGVTFEDRGVPPLHSSAYGDAGDPMLAVDRASGAVYLAGTSPRNTAGLYGIPLWKSTDGGVTFSNLSIALSNILQSDGPSLAVDDWAGTGQHDVYVTSKGRTSPVETYNSWLAISTDGGGSYWTNPPVLVRAADGTNASAVGSPVVLISSNHISYAFWGENTGPYFSPTNWLKMRTIAERGTILGEVRPILRLVTTNVIGGNLELKRSNTAADSDTFRAFPNPVPALNPAKAGHLYVAYADKGEDSGDKADVFFVSSTDGGTNWTSPARVSTVGTNDQWMPVLAVKPDGTQLFLAWYDRRNDTNNSLIELYGRWGTVATNGDVAFGTEFKISTTNFPPVFAGTDTNNIEPGHYDPVYPPGSVNLHWWYPEWPAPPPPPEEDGNTTFDVFKDHVGEYNGAWADDMSVCLVWTDYRLESLHTLYPRNQSDVRLVRITWPH